mmetsp:Transcript_68561/g.149185  ORF Transcript_68561/g.149185 Transcript_68561/m.149185 type:complete len:203 (+) Transcript_68561:477-1085(+)
MLSLGAPTISNLVSPFWLFCDLARISTTCACLTVGLEPTGVSKYWIKSRAIGPLSSVLVGSNGARSTASSAPLASSPATTSAAGRLSAAGGAGVCEKTFQLFGSCSCHACSANAGNGAPSCATTPAAPAAARMPRRLSEAASAAAGRKDLTGSKRLSGNSITGTRMHRRLPRRPEAAVPARSRAIGRTRARRGLKKKSLGQC